MHQFGSITRFILMVLFILSAQTLLPPSTIAQIDWLKAGKDLLGTVSKPTQERTSTLSSADISSGLKEALRVGTETVVGQLGQADGFNADQAVHIPLPESLQKVKSALSAIGMASMMDDLELKLNRAAEQATPPAKKLFWTAIEEMTLEDIKGIYNGPDDAATRYFQGKMSAPLAEEMQPIVDQALSQVGAIQAYDAVMSQYATLPFMPKIKANLQDHVIEKGMQGIFYYLAKEEAAIRKDPVKRTTEILQTVFGAQ